MNKEIIINNIKNNVINNAKQNGLEIKIVDTKQIELTEKLNDKNKIVYSTPIRFQRKCIKLLFDK